jgi:hypothetical protein
MHWTTQKSTIGVVMTFIGLAITSVPLMGSSFHLDLGDVNGTLPYMKLLLLSTGVLAIGLAVITFSFHLMKKVIWVSIAALALAIVAFGCFAFGTFIKCSLLGIIAIVAVIWEIGRMELEG